MDSNAREIKGLTADGRRFTQISDYPQITQISQITFQGLLQQRARDSVRSSTVSIGLQRELSLERNLRNLRNLRIIFVLLVSQRRARGQIPSCTGEQAHQRLVFTVRDQCHLCSSLGNTVNL